MEKDPQDQIAKSWNENATRWTTAIRTHALESRRLVTDEAILKAVLNTGGMRILDVGCGEGWLAHRLAAEGRTVTGFDACEALIVEARTGAGNFLILGYDEFADRPHLVGNNFDVAVCNFSILNENVVPLLQGLHRVLISSGHLLIQTVHPITASAGLAYHDGWREETFASLPGTWTSMPWYFRTISSWFSALRSSRWQIRDCSEPLHPTTNSPASIIFDATKEQS